ncbi:sensor histidine kinase [Actinotalea subterranea]|uniref:sensor histidine kinase n=1 Tax=Actinotalea subterranea TaxID=2607497 RepID=UPI001FE97FF3|nr:HAMP domain-containing sensor histidine kinase [Actinotalea subterranea]
MAYALVRVIAPQMYDHSVQMMMSADMGGGMRLRAAAVSATNNALVIGVLAGVATAAVAGAWSARRILVPLVQIRAATRRLAEGHYDRPVAVPPDAELADLVTDVNALARRLAETEARRQELLGEVAHEMRTPLTVLEGYVEGMIDGVFPASGQTLGELGPELARLRRLSEDLSALSKAEERGFELRMRRVDLGALAVRAVERLRPQFVDADVALRASAGVTPAEVIGDADRLTQVLMNLLGNALVATPPGGSVEVTVESAGEAVRVEVRDTGEGIDAPHLDRIFERFYRVRGSRPVEEGRHHGSGIGLTIARAIARAHRGDLTASSAGAGQGSTFVVELPEAPPAGPTSVDAA